MQPKLPLPASGDYMEKVLKAGANLRYIVIPIFIPHKGCPFDCIYCNQKAISGEIEEMTEDRIREIIESHLASIDFECHVEIGFYGGSFTGIERDVQIRYLKTANEYMGQKGLKSIRLSTRPDYIDRDILEYLKKYNVAAIELGAQSLDTDVLRCSFRGHDATTVEKAASLIKEFGIKLGIQTMIGLPEDSYKKDIETALRVAAMKPDIVRIYPALVIKGTYLERMFYNNQYKPLSIDEAALICAELLDIYERNGIQVIRVGLQPTDTVNEGMDVVAGPFHPAFRQLAESKRILKKLELLINENNLAHVKNIKILAANKNISNITGQKKSNVKFLKDKYGFKIIKIEGCQSLKGNEIKIIEYS